MKIKTRPYECNNSICDANKGKYCMWNIDKKIIELAKDENYRRGICPLLKKEVEKIIARELWDEFGDVIMNPNTEKIEEDWNGFPAGTHREEIWYWFEETFHISVAEDLMGQNKD